MPKMACRTCEVMLEIEMNGVEVIEMFCDPPEPYLITSADLWVCPSCGAKIVAGFGSTGVYHHEEKFGKVLEHALAHNHVFVYEKP